MNSLTEPFKPQTTYQMAFSAMMNNLEGLHMCESCSNFMLAYEDYFYDTFNDKVRIYDVSLFSKIWDAYMIMQKEHDNPIYDYTDQKDVMLGLSYIYEQKAKAIAIASAAMHDWLNTRMMNKVIEHGQALIKEQDKEEMLKKREEK
jgi:hypothetical protein